MIFDVEDTHTHQDIECLGSEFGYCDYCKIKFRCYTGWIFYDYYISRPENIHDYPNYLSFLAFGVRDYSLLFNVCY